MQNYSGAVPAVQRAIAALDHLRTSETAPTLTELSQALGLNRSSVLAILNTLRSAGWVSRDDADRYALGPALLAYAPRVARANGPLDVFDQPAQMLVDALGETVALVRLAQQGAVYVAVKTGYYSVRAVIDRGQVTPLVQSAGGLAVLAALPEEGVAAVIAAERIDDHELRERLAMVRQCGCAWLEDALELGQVSLAAPVCDIDGRPVAAIELLGPSSRIVGDGLSQAGQMVIGAARQASQALGCATYKPYAAGPSDSWLAAHPGSLRGAELDAFLGGPWLARLACLREDGYPYSLPLWYEWRDGHIWLAPQPGARWPAYLQVNRRVSMAIDEPAPPFRRVLIEGEASSESARGLERRLAQRYLGPLAEGYLRKTAGHAGQAIRVAPARVTSWTGLVAHPLYEAPSARAERAG
ncbi:MAG: helix-turn-helix domain-containing protein [Chloroflexi bacterium]|nr:helix-turn-helix domain-containing protein [Chloroflexota bacterium]